MEEKRGFMSPEDVKTVAEINEISQNLDTVGKAKVLGFVSALNMENMEKSQSKPQGAATA